MKLNYEGKVVGSERRKCCMGKCGKFLEISGNFFEHFYPIFILHLYFRANYPFLATSRYYFFAIFDELIP